VEIQADAIVSPTVRPCRSLAAFSGGVDSTFTLFRNNPRSDTPRYGVDTVVLVQGFDVDLDNDAAFRELVERTDAVRAVTGARLRTVRTNCKELRLQKWEDSCGAQLAACLHLFAAEFTHALIGGSDAYDELWLPWGTNPVTDHLLSGGQLAIVHDGAAFSRTDKLACLARVPAALRSLKVCWEGQHQGRNCGVCEKCVRTQLNLMAVGVSSAPCFARWLDLQEIRTLPIHTDLAMAELRSIIEYGERHHLDAEWFHALRRRFGRGRTRKRIPLKDRARRWLARAGLLGAVRTGGRRLAALVRSSPHPLAAASHSTEPDTAVAPAGCETSDTSGVKA
jgi:hypothetical protein